MGYQMQPLMHVVNSDSAFINNYGLSQFGFHNDSIYETAAKVYNYFILKTME